MKKVREFLQKTYYLMSGVLITVTIDATNIKNIIIVFISYIATSIILFYIIDNKKINA